MAAGPSKIVEVAHATTKLKEACTATAPAILNSSGSKTCGEDAITIKNDKSGQETWIVSGGAYHASDKVVQDNGCGTVNIINFYVENYGKFYRSCGNCFSQCKRNVYIEGTIAVNGGELAGINSNFGDTATLRNCCYDVAHPCQMDHGNNKGDEPTKSGYCSG
ncbi:hypothetical protein ACMFMG_010267 [Clarireedia jacksonii]